MAELPQFQALFDQAHMGQLQEQERQREEKQQLLLDPEIVINQEVLSDNIKCPICHNIFYEPVACSNCLNHFCSYCILQSLRYNKRCPLCQQFKEIRRAVPLLRSMLAPIILQCQNKQNGCQKQITYDSYKKHSEECEYQYDVCENGLAQQKCGQKILRLKMFEHQEKQCLLRKIQCQFCQEKPYYKDLQQHEQACPEAPIVCPKCLEQHKRRDFQDHPMVCSENFVSCNHCKQQYLFSKLVNHEPECDLRNVLCIGCSQLMELRNYYKHMNECLDFPIMCPNCQIKMPRHQYINHSTQQCISSIRHYCQEQLQRLQDDLKDTKNELQKYKQKIQKEDIMFSNFMKDNDVFISPCRLIATVREQKKKRKDRFALFQNPISTQQDTTWTIKINTLKSEWFAVGISDGGSIYSLRRYQDIGHGSYLVSANGIVYNSHSPIENWHQSSFKIEQGDLIRVQHKFQDKVLIFTNQTKDLSCNITLDIDDQIPFYPCVCLRTASDQVQIQK